MNLSLRQIHRWTSIAFTLSVVATVVALSLGESFVWVSYTPLLPLALLLATGLYLFARPYLDRRRAARSARMSSFDAVDRRPSD